MVGRHLARLVLVAVVTLAAARAHAQAGIDVQQFRPVPDQSLGYFNLSAAELLPGGVWEVGLITHFADDPLVLVDDLGARLAAVVDYQLTLDLVGAIGLLDVLEVGLGVPLFLAQDGDPAPEIPGASATDAGFGLGDIRLLGRGRLFSNARPEALVGLTLSLAAELTLPTGDETRYQGEGTRGEARLLFDVGIRGGHRLSLNLGYRARPHRQLGNLELDDTVTFGLGTSVQLAPRWRALAEVVGEISVLAASVDPEETPLEVLVGAKATPSEHLLVTFGAGTGLTQGFGMADWRLFVGASLRGRLASDDDGDGLSGDDDRCPAEPEDHDGYRDDDGCPDPDNDGDTIPDIVDGCPVDAEDFDHREDADGCPDPDNDGDGVPDVRDRCPLRAGEAEGCPP